MLKMNASPAECFRSAVWHAVHGHVEVKANDYKLVCCIDPRAMWLKSCILVSRYITTMNEKFPAGHVATNSNFEGRKATVVANRMKPAVAKELAADLPTVKCLEGSVKQILGHYPVTNPEKDRIMTARGTLFANIGKLSLKIGAALDQASMKAQAMNKTLIQSERADVSSKVMKGQLAEIEEKYRADLMIAMGVTDADFATKIFVKSKDEATISTDSKPSGQPVAVANLISKSGEGMLSEEVTLTRTIVLRRLGLQGVPAPVGLTNLGFIANEDWSSIHQVYLG